MMTVYLIITACSLSLTALAQTQTGSGIPLDVKETIHSWVMNDILNYRLWINPEFTKEDRLKSINPAVYSTYNDKIFKKPLIDGEGLILEISRWPKDEPRTNYYLVTKKGNHFIRWRDENNKQLGRDTVSVPEYDKFNKYYPGDESFLIFYDGKDTYKKVSGNFIQNWYTPDWFTNKAPGQAAWFRMAQYNAKHPYRVIDKPDEWLLFFEKCDFIKNDPGAFIVRMKKKWYYTLFDIVYYSNKKEITGDDSRQNFYEVKYSRDYSNHEWPASFADTLPKIRKLNSEEIKELNGYYGDVIYKFGDVDYSVVNGDN